MGRLEQALASTEEAVAIYRRLAQANPDTHLPDLAQSLGAYALVCVNVPANLPQALEAITESISLYRPLAQQYPQVFGGLLLEASGLLSDVLKGLGRRK